MIIRCLVLQNMPALHLLTSSVTSVRPRFLAEVADLGQEMRPEALPLPGAGNRLFEDKPAADAARSAACMPTALKRAVFKKRKNLKNGATGAVGMCASRRDVHISIAEGVSGNERGGERVAFSTPVGVRAVRCGQRDSVTLSMPSGVQACMAGGAAA